MENTRIETIKTSMKVGAVLGGIVFIFFGILPGFHFGSAGVLMLMSKIVGGPVEASLLARVMMVLGAVLGISCFGMLSIVLGSVFGTASGYVISAFTGVEAKEAQKEVA
ncbi:MAG: hypothetical protein R3231_08660 [bacterium]|nr:hypothetical protein [bacterium]